MVGLIERVVHDWVSKYKYPEDFDLDVLVKDLNREISKQQFRISYKTPDKVVKLKTLIGDRE